MRKVILACAVVMLPVAAQAQQPTSKPPAVDSTAGVAAEVPLPRTESGYDDYRLMAIAAGTVGGVVAANALTGGLITPVLTAGMSGGSMMSGGSYAMAATTVVTATGAAVGAYVGDWLYGY